MKVGRDSAAVKRRFGSFLRASRLEKDWGVYDVGRMLGVTQGTVFHWEVGHSFPASIVRLKKLCLLYDKVPETVKDLARRMCPGGGKWRRFEEEVGRTKVPVVLSDRLMCRSVSNDERDTKYKVAFGEYLRRERTDMCVSQAALAKALGVFNSSVSAWESGTSFPQSVTVLATLDRLYGNLFDVLFGLCKKHGIHLGMDEVKEVLEARDDIEGMARWSRGKDGLWRAA